MNFRIKGRASGTMIRCAIKDISGSVTIVIELRNRDGHIQSEKATIVAMSLMILFLFVGEELLQLIGVDLPSVAIAGSFVIFFISMEMILGINFFKDEVQETV